MRGVSAPGRSPVGPDVRAITLRGDPESVLTTRNCGGGHGGRHHSEQPMLSTSGHC